MSAVRPRPQTLPAGGTDRPVAPEARRCAACGSTRVTVLSLQLDDGVPVDFTSCQDCEHRTWRGSSGVLPLESVKAAAAAGSSSRRRPRRD